MDRVLVFILICVLTFLVTVVGTELRTDFMRTTGIQLDFTTNTITR